MIDKTSQTLIFFNYAAIVASLIYAVASFMFIRRTNLDTAFILTLPSILIPSLIIMGYCMPLVWALFDGNFKISYLSMEALDQTVLFIFGSAISIFLGMLIGRWKVIREINFVLPGRSMDGLFFGKIGNDLTILLILISVLTFPFAFGLRVDLIFGSGIRGLEVHDKVLFALIPFARIMLSIFTFLSGIILAYRKSRIIIIVPLLEVLQHLMKLSRGFFIPFILFLFAFSLSGKKVSNWVYFLIVLLGFASGSAAIGARGLSAQGIGGITAGVNQLIASPIELIREFFQANATIGLISTSVNLRDPSSDLIDGFLAWLQSILPVPTFFELTGEHLSTSALLNLTHAGIPMPALGEIYFRMGWGGLLIVLVFGFCLGKVEGELIKHTLIYGMSYWPHILIWLSMLFGFILSFHSPTRSASRLLFYSLLIIATVKLCINNKVISKFFT